MANELGLWIGFLIFILAMLAIDLGVFHHKNHEVKIKEALIWSAVWISLALVFNGILYFWRGSEDAMAFLAGYLLEKSLSVDNLFVFILIFTYFRVPSIYQHKILFWGVLGALVMRAIFITAGVTLLHTFHWIVYLFGVVLIVTGIRMALQNEEQEIHPEKNPVLKLFKRFMPVTPHYGNGKFFLFENSLWAATPLLVVLIIVETTDLVFAVDSIPAVLAISHDPFIVFTSNVFAILGLRALYFALAGVMQLFHYLHYGLSAVLVFVGVKMLISDIYKIPIGVALGVLAAILTISIIASLLFRPKEVETEPASSGELPKNI